MEFIAYMMVFYIFWATSWKISSKLFQNPGRKVGRDRGIIISRNKRRRNPLGHIPTNESRALVKGASDLQYRIRE